MILFAYSLFNNSSIKMSHEPQPVLAPVADDILSSVSTPLSMSCLIFTSVVPVQVQITFSCLSGLSSVIEGFKIVRQGMCIISSAQSEHRLLTLLNILRVETMQLISI